MTFKDEEGLLKGRGVRVGVLHECRCHAHDEVRPGKQELRYENIG